MARMIEIRLLAPFARLDAWEGGVCRRCNALIRLPGVRRYFSTVSRLGDGGAWCALLAALPLAFGTAALGPALHMGLTALAGVLIYKLIKGTLNRERPFTAQAGVEAVLPPLDRCSFPSGHTLHAVAFSVMIAHYYPLLLIIALPFAFSVALSRVILGLHYPTDVLAGALIGLALARASIAAFPAV